VIEGPYHHGDLKVSALAFATKLVHDHGVEALTLRKLAEKAEVSHAALYRHFKDRNALLDEVAAQWLRTLVGKLNETTTVAEALQTYVAYALSSKELYRLAFSMVASANALHTKTAMTELRDIAAKIFVVDGMSEDHVRDRVLAVWSTMHGMIDLHWHGLIRARSQRAATEYIVAAAQR
jgi:AcrR family transcriptional regulator